MYVIAEPELGSTLRLKIFVEKAAVDKAYRKLYDDISDRGSVPGFRPGHVPAWRARRHYGEQLCDQTVMGELLQDSMEKALTYGELNALEPAGFGDDEEPSATEGRPVETEATLVVRPEVHLPAFEGIAIEVPDTEPTEEQIDTAIRELRDAAAETVEVERKDVQKGDLVDVTMKTTVEGEEADEAEEREESFIVGEARYDPALDEHILGHAVGDTVEFAVEYPRKRSMGDLAGKTVAMTLTVTGLHERKMPDLDDEFAAKAADAENVAALREKVAEQVRRENGEMAAAILESRAGRWLSEHLRIDLPGSFREGLPADADEAKQALTSVSVYLACQEILTERGVTVTDDDVRAEWVEAGTRAGLKPEQLAGDTLPRDITDQLRERLVRRRALAIVGQAATQTAVPWAEFMQQSDELSDSESPESVEEEGSVASTEATEEQQDG